MDKLQFDEGYWNERYLQHETGWDVGEVSRPIKEYIDQLTDKHVSILIPGCGNAYEAAYLLKNGFTNITLVDISPILVENIRERLKGFGPSNLQIHCADFFTLQGKFDLVIEQTFFCALHPSSRERYADKLHELLQVGGKLAGVLFNRLFEGGPPFGGTKEEYERLFSKKFKISRMEPCYNSIGPRQGNELFIILKKPL